MLEPRYDEDVVNLGYLKRALGLTNEQTEELYKYINRNYKTKPQPPYYAGDTWIDGEIVYTCIKERLVGIYQDSDWVTESGAKEEAESKNKTYLTQPSNYSAGDMWILQSDSDHPAGIRGEILVTTVGRNTYVETDWVKKVSYGTVEYIDSLKDATDEELETITERTVEISTNLGIVTNQVSETTTRLNNNYLTSEQIEAENQTLKDDIGLIKQQQTTTTQTAQGLQVQIDTINNDGVKIVRNTTVEIDERGVSVGKANSEFSTTMSNTGTTMYAYGREIAKYTKDGAETANFKATGEVEIGYLKIIKGTINNERRTHIHFVG